MPPERAAFFMPRRRRFCHPGGVTPDLRRRHRVCRACRGGRLCAAVALLRRGGRTESSAPAQNRRCPEFYTSNIQRALTKRLSQRFARSGNPILRSPEGRSLTTGVTITRTTERHVFLRVSAIERVQRLFFAYFFLARQKKVCPRSDSCGLTA